MTFCFHSYSSIVHFSKFWVVETETETETENKSKQAHQMWDPLYLSDE